jgi:hypothetical protein
LATRSRFLANAINSLRSGFVILVVVIHQKEEVNLGCRAWAARAISLPELQDSRAALAGVLLALQLS